MKWWTNEEEAERLARRFQGVNQAEFARKHGIKGGASMVSQHIHGRRPLSLEAATSYAKAFGCPLAEISPRLAAQVDKALTGVAADQSEAKAPEGTAARRALEVLGSSLAAASPQTREAVAAMLASFAKDPAGGGAIADAIALLLEPKASHRSQANRKAA
jgi:hypothetical protein